VRYLAVLLVACAPAVAPKPVPKPPAPVETCGGPPMSVHFYDVGQALAALVILPDGRRILVDAGESPKRCGKPCELANDHLIGELRKDLGDRPIDLLWITHQHSDHLGGVPEVAASFHILSYADNGHDLTKKGVEKAREAATASGAQITVVDPEHATAPIASLAPVTITAVLPKQWPAKCESHANDCSIALRIDYCRSSVLFVGDAEAREEATLDVKPVTLLQVGHHGSHTSSSEAFLAKVQPRYAVISSGKPGEAMNASFCHPRANTVEALAHALGGTATMTVRSFSGQSCKDDVPDDWRDVPTPATLYSTARDGDIRLVTNGNGTFERSAI
jgi:competence protein ComEC